MDEKLQSQFVDLVNGADDIFNKGVNAAFTPGAVNDFITKSGKTLKELVIGSTRVTNSPTTFKVEHTSKAFFMNKAAITGIQVQFRGPWIKTKYTGVASSGFGSTAFGKQIDRLVRDEYNKVMTFEESCYPSNAEVTLTLRETAFITGTDWLEHLLGSNDKTVSVTDAANQSIGKLAQNTAVSDRLVAAGVANLGTVLPDMQGVGDIIGGGKWVPPGETISGLGGFL